MSDASTKRLLNAYLETSIQKPGFFTQFFTPTFFNQEKVEVDVRRAGNRIAPVLTALGDGLHRSESSQYVNKDYTPPVYGEEFALSTLSALKRLPGVDPFQSLDYLKSLQTQFQYEMSIREEMIRRGIELQCSQLLRSGVLTLPGVGGTTAFTLDYQPKSTHFPTPQADWDEPSGTDRMGDVSSLCDVVWADGNARPKYLIMGEKAYNSWVADAVVQSQILRTGTGIGALVQPTPRNGGSYKGQISVGEFVLDMYTCHQIYQSLTDASNTKYLGDWEVIVLAEGARLDLAFGDIPSVIPVDPRLAPLGVGRASSESGFIDLISNAWFSPNGRSIFGSLEARPLAIPTAIDTFGMILTKVS